MKRWQAMENCIEISNLGFAYPNKQVFANLSFTQKKSEFLAIIGQSGCGKSTLLRLISQLLLPSAGTIQLNSQPSILFQDDRLLPWRTCLENVRLGVTRNSSSHSVKNDRNKEEIRALFKKLQIPAVSNQYPKALSGGMRQRVALARALISQPDLLLLDEPFAAVDHLTRQTLIAELFGELNQLRKTRPFSMILVTHNIDEALFLCDRVIILGRTPSSIQHALKVPELPTDWKHFFQSKDATNLKLDILGMMKTLQQ